MPPSLSPQKFVTKWRKVDLKERSASQSHFNALCRLVGHRTPVEDDPTGETFAFQTGASEGRRIGKILSGQLLERIGRTLPIILPAAKDGFQINSSWAANRIFVPSVQE